MGMLSSLMAEPVHGRGLNDWLFGSGGGRKVASGVVVNHKTAMNYSACWAAKRLITETIATLPRVMYRQSDGKKEHARDHKTYRVFRSEPNLRQAGVNHMAQQFGFVIDWGDCFAEKVVDDLGRTIALWPIHPSRIPEGNIKENPDGSLVYFVMNNAGPPSRLEQHEMFHVPGIMSENGYRGKGVIVHAAESIGLGLATEQYGAAHFGNAGGPAIVMTHPKTLGEEAANNLRRSWHKRYTGPDKANGFLVLEEGTTVEHLSFPPEANQFLQTRQFNITEIARWYNLPPHLLRELSKSSFSNIESESLHFVLLSIMPWLIRYEDECNRQLLIESEKSEYFFKFQIQGMLRGDMTARANFYKEMYAMGVYSINDILELEDRNPIGAKGDLRFVPLNTTPLDNVYNTMKPKNIETVPTVGGAPVATDATANVQATALNGAQIVALLQMGQELAAGNLPPDGTHAMIEGSFPSMEAKLIDTIVKDFTKFAETQKDEPVPAIEQQPPPTPPAAEPAKPEEPKDEAASLMRTVLATAAQSVLSSTIRDMIWYEGKKAVTEAKNSRGFEAWCNAFYDEKFATLFADKTRPMLAASTLFGATVTAEQLTTIHCDQSRSELLALLATPLSDFANAVQATVESWESRSITEAALVFKINDQ